MLVKIKMEGKGYEERDGEEREGRGESWEARRKGRKRGIKKRQRWEVRKREKGRKVGKSDNYRNLT